MIELKNIDLRFDPDARWYVKDEVVQVAFARQEGELVSLEGPNRYLAGDALITGSTGSRWSVSRERFDSRYEAVSPVRQGEDGPYRNRPVPVLAKQMKVPFSIARSEGGDRLSGESGDWLMQYAPGDFGITEHSRFAQVYRISAK
jgi:hypothetical protein